MSYLNRTHSVSDGQPVTLYRFTLGRGEREWRFTDADCDVTVNGEKWLATAVSDSGRRTGDNLSVTLPSDNAVAQLFRGIAPSQSMTLTVMRLHWQDNEIRVVWIGTIIEAKRPDVHQTQLISAGLSSTMRSAGLRLMWGRSCPYALYDTDCKVDKAKFAVAGLRVQALDGVSVTVNFPHVVAQHHFNAGFIEWTDNSGVREVRAVTVHENNRLTLMGGTQKISVGTLITVYPGCDGQVKTCRDKFNNVLNFGGIPHMPNKSPYDGSRIF